MENPFWIEDKDLGVGPKGQLTTKEVEFFEELIEKYLKPLDEDKVRRNIFRQSEVVVPDGFSLLTTFPFMVENGGKMFVFASTLYN